LTLDAPGFGFCLLFSDDDMFYSRDNLTTMIGYHINLKHKTLDNNNFREVLFTTGRSQLVVMALQPGEEIGMEVHEDHDQFIRVESGKGRAVIDDVEYDLMGGSAIVIPAGANHNVINILTEEKMKLYTIYTPPEHVDGTVHATKADAEAAGH
jgi:mannose-6-phosphate isomerase-like protein (cupin superfamily)